MKEWGSSFCKGLKESYQTLDILSFSHPTAFLIKSKGKYKGSEIHLEALLYDISSASLKHQKIRYYQMQKQKEQELESEPIQASQNQIAQPNEKSPPKKSTSNYSYHKSLIIMYLKESS